ncbi:MAG: tetratricopeptide repeat protein [bacterium]
MPGRPAGHNLHGTTEVFQLGTAVAHGVESRAVQNLAIQQREMINMYPLADRRQSYGNHPSHVILNLLVLASLLVAPTLVLATEPVVSSAEGRALIAADPANPTCYIQASLAAYRENNIAEAISILEHGREDADPSAELLVTLAALYTDQNLLADAEQMTRAALGLDPDFVDAHLQLADISLRLGWLNHGITSLKRAVQLDPKHGRAWLRLGQAQLEGRFYKDAAVSLVNACEYLDPATDALVALGNLRLQQHRYDESTRFFQQALNDDDSDIEAQRGLVCSLLGENQAHDAETACRDFLARNPDRPELWLALGEVLEKQEKLTEAFGSYGQALGLDPQYTAALSRRGRLYCRFQQYDAAAVECRNALALDPDDSLAHAYLAIACANLGQKDEARQHAQTAEAAGMRMESVWEIIGR